MYLRVYTLKEYLVFFYHLHLVEVLANANHIRDPIPPRIGLLHLPVCFSFLTQPCGTPFFPKQQQPPLSRMQQQRRRPQQQRILSLSRGCGHVKFTALKFACTNFTYLQHSSSWRLLTHTHTHKHTHTPHTTHTNTPTHTH